jgi:hypothetical protein
LPYVVLSPTVTGRRLLRGVGTEIVPCFNLRGT